MVSDWHALEERVAGKWQVPLLVVALVMLALSVMRLNPGPSELPFPEAIAQLNARVEVGRYVEAAEYATELLARGDATSVDQAHVHLALARVRSGWVEENGIPSAAVGTQIVEDFEIAIDYALPLTVGDIESMGKALEWRRAYADAVDRYEQALEMGVDHPLDLRRHVLALRFNRLDTQPEEMVALLRDFLVDLGEERLDLRMWSVERLLDAYRSLGRFAEASTLLARHESALRDSEFEDRFRYLESWVLFETGHYDEAEIHLRVLRNHLSKTDEVYSMSGWLLGRVVLSDGGPQRPQEALSFFEDALKYLPQGPYAVASRIGMAEAQVMLEQHEGALDAYRFATEELATLQDPYPVSRDALRTSLGVAAETLRQADRIKDAIAYAAMAVSLVDRGDLEIASLHLHQLAQLQYLDALRKEGLPDPGTEPSSRPPEAQSDAGRTAFAAAASTYMDLARLESLNTRRAADASWWAAELYAHAGLRDRSAELYRRFSVENPTHALVPRALLRIGQLHQVSRRMHDAVAIYQECYRRFPRTLEGSRALVPLAESYMAMGPDFNELAEKTLLIVLGDSEVFTPKAAEFTDAMFLLGDVLTRSGQFERAISVLEESLERYPTDPRVWEARFRFGGAYRESGLALKADANAAKSPGELEQLRLESGNRFRTARKIYREFIVRYESRAPDSLNRLERTYLRHADLYEADCFFETQDYTRALALYEQAAGIYKDLPDALAAYVQIINSNVFLGKPDEARAALARALVLADAIPDATFAESLSPENRADWKRYLTWLGESGLF